MSAAPGRAESIDLAACMESVRFAELAARDGEAQAAFQVFGLQPYLVRRLLAVLPERQATERTWRHLASVHVWDEQEVRDLAWRELRWDMLKDLYERGEALVYEPEQRVTYVAWDPSRNDDGYVEVEDAAHADIVRLDLVAKVRRLTPERR